MNEIEWLISVSRYKNSKALVYFSIMQTKDLLLIEYEDNKPVGFMEVWPITFEQLGRLACMQFNYWEANGGPVGYVAEVYAENTKVFRNLISKAYEKYKSQFVAWHRKGKDLVVYRSKKNG